MILEWQVIFTFFLFLVLTNIHNGHCLIKSINNYCYVSLEGQWGRAAKHLSELCCSRLLLTCVTLGNSPDLSFYFCTKDLVMSSLCWLVLSITVESLWKCRAQRMAHGKLNKSKLVKGAIIVVLLIPVTVEMRDPWCQKNVKNSSSQLQGPLSAGWPLVRKARRAPL